MELVDCDTDLQFVEAPEFSGYEQFVIRKFSNIKISRKQVHPLGNKIGYLLYSLCDSAKLLATVYCRYYQS